MHPSLKSFLIGFPVLAGIVAACIALIIAVILWLPYMLLIGLAVCVVYIIIKFSIAIGEDIVQLKK